MLLKDKAFASGQTFKVAIDGTSASGKGTIGRKLADRLKSTYFDSGMLYRKLAHSCINQGININDRTEIIALSSKIDADLKGLDLSDEKIAATTSIIAVIPEVRINITAYLQKIIHNSPRIIMDGRDIGSTVMPEADLKIFITAAIKIRAERRYNQLIKNGKNYIMAEILTQLAARDSRDQNRETGALYATPDAFIIDTSFLNVEEIIDKILDHITNAK